MLGNNTLGKSPRNTKGLINTQNPDTDSRRIELNQQGLSVTPNLMNDHTFLVYTTPSGNTQPVVFNSPLQKEERSLHYIILDNSNNGSAKQFTFSADYKFLDELGTQIYTLAAGEVKV